MPFPGTQQLPFIFNGGLNSVTAQFSLDSPYLQNANNCVYNQQGQLDQRTGFSATSTAILNGGNIINGQALGVFNDELLCMDGETLYSYDKDNNIWIGRGPLYSTINDQIRVINTKIATQSNPDTTTLNGIQVYIWEDNRVHPANAAGIRYSVRDTNTGAFLVSDKFVYPLGSRCKTLSVPNRDQIQVYYQASQSVLFTNNINLNLPQILTPLTAAFLDGYSTAGHLAYDVCLSPTGNPVIAYCNTLGLSIINNGVLSIVAAGTFAKVIAVCTTSDGSIWMGYTDITGGTWLINTTTFDTQQIDTRSAVNIAIIEDVNKGNINITYEIAGDTSTTNYIVNAILQWNNVILEVGTQLKVGLASKPFQVANSIFINTIAFSNLQSTYFTLNLSKNFAVIAKHSPQNGGSYRDNTLLSQCDPITGVNYCFAGQRKGPFTSYQNSQTTNLGVAGYTIDFNSSNAFNNITDNNNLHIVGGIKKIYDGITCVEDNFNLFPELSDGNSCQVTLTNSGQLGYSALTDGYSYQWCVCYEWTDNFGQVQRSSPGVAVTAVTTQSGQGAQIVIPTLTLTDKTNVRSPICLSVFRTQGNLPIFYKITDDDNPIVNDITVNTVTFQDNLSDADIGANENLYTGSQLANSAPPACSLISLYQNRLMINSTEDGDVVWFSQNKFEQDQYNTLPLDWNTSFVEGVNSQFGDITTIGLLGTSLAIFKKTSIFLLTGDGPNAFDTTGQFNDAQLLVSNVGCTNANSLVFITQTPSLPGGLMFKSAQGIYLLGLDNNLYPIGAPVNQYNNLTITSANLVPSKNMVIFTTLEGTCLVYNYFFNAWTTWSDLPAVDAVVWQEQLALLTPNGTVMLQDTTNTVFIDTFEYTSTPVSMTITTPWVKLGGVNNQQGKMCVYNALILGTLQAQCNLRVDVSYDYNPSIFETCTINSTVTGNYWGGLPLWAALGVWANKIFSNYQFEVNFQNPRGATGDGCQAVQLTLTSLPPPPGTPQPIGETGTPGYSLNGIVFEVLPIPGPFNVPLANKLGAAGY